MRIREALFHIARSMRKFIQNPKLTTIVRSEGKCMILTIYGFTTEEIQKGRNLLRMSRDSLSTFEDLNDGFVITAKWDDL